MKKPQKTKEKQQNTKKIKKKPIDKQTQIWYSVYRKRGLIPKTAKNVFGFTKNEINYLLKYNERVGSLL